MNFPVVIQQKRKWNTSSIWTLLLNKRLEVKRDQDIGGSRERLVRGLVGKLEPLSWGSCLLFREGRKEDHYKPREERRSGARFRHSLETQSHSKPADPLAPSLSPIFLPWSTGNWWMQRAGANSLSMGRAHQLVIHKQHHTDWEGLFTSLRIYMYIHICMYGFERQSKEEYMGRLKKRK